MSVFSDRKIAADSAVSPAKARKDAGEAGVAADRKKKDADDERKARSNKMWAGSSDL